MIKLDPLKLQFLKVYLYALADPPMSVMFREIEKLEKMVDEFNQAELVDNEMMMEEVEHLEVIRQ